MMKKTRWSIEEDALLKSLHGTMTIAKLASALSKTPASIRGRITRVGISKKSNWSAEDEAVLISAYTAAGPDGFIDLKKLSELLGRERGNICRKAKLLGMGVNQKRKKVAVRKVSQNKFSNAADRSAAQSLRQKDQIRLNGHPRGMLGKSHSESTKRHLSETSTAANLSISDDELTRRVKKSAATRMLNGTSGPQKVSRGTWRAGWRTVGGKENYYRSMWEANYARYLEWLKCLGEIKDWAHEPETFWFESIRRGVRSYKPDFRVWENNGSSNLHEVKGWMDDRSRTTLSRMAKYHPSEKIILIDERQYKSIRKNVMRLIPEWENSERDAR